MKTRPVTSALVALSLAALPAFAQPLKAQERVRSARTSAARLIQATNRAPFPENTYAVVSFEGLMACRKAAKSSALLELIRTKTSEIAGFDPVDAIVVEGLPQMEEMLQQVGVSRRDVRDLMRCPMQLAVSRITFFGEDPAPGLALAIDTSAGGAEAVARLSDTFFQMMTSMAPNEMLSVEERTIEGVQARCMTHAKEIGSVVGGQIGDWYVLTDNDSYFAEIVRTSKSGAKTVFDSKGFRWSDSRQAGDNLASIWLNTGPFYDALGLLLPYDADPILDALGLERLNGVYIGMDALPNSGSEVMRIAADHSEDGVLAALVQPGLDANVARYLPPETLLYAGAHVDAQKLIRAFDGLFQSLPKNVRNEMRSGLGEMDEMLGDMGMSMAELLDTVSQFGSQVAFGVASSSQVIPDGYVFLGTRREGFVDLLAAMLEEQGAPVKSQDLRSGQTMYFVSLPMEEVRVTPAICEVDGGILLASSPMALKAALARAEGKRPSLADADDFKKRMANSQDAAAMFLLRLETVGADLYKQYVPLLRGVLEAEAPEGILPEDLPTADEMREAMADFVVTVSRDRGGITIRTESFLSTGSLLTMLGGIADEVLSTDLERDN